MPAKDQLLSRFKLPQNKTLKILKKKFGSDNSIKNKLPYPAIFLKIGACYKVIVGISIYKQRKNNKRKKMFLIMWYKNKYLIKIKHLHMEKYFILRNGGKVRKINLKIFFVIWWKRLFLFFKWRFSLKWWSLHLSRGYNRLNENWSYFDVERIKLHSFC